MTNYNNIVFISNKRKSSPIVHCRLSSNEMLLWYFHKVSLVSHLLFYLTLRQYRYAFYEFSKIIWRHLLITDMSFSQSIVAEPSTVQYEVGKVALRTSDATNMEPPKKLDYASINILESSLLHLEYCNNN